MMNGHVLREATFPKAASQFVATCCNYQGMTREWEKQVCPADPFQIVLKTKIPHWILFSRRSGTDSKCSSFKMSFSGASRVVDSVQSQTSQTTKWSATLTKNTYINPLKFCGTAGLNHCFNLKTHLLSSLYFHPECLGKGVWAGE